MLVNQWFIALGEFANLEAYSWGSDTVLFLSFFILTTFVTQITMFNMLIAIMSDTFDNINENKEANAIKSKLSLMGDLAYLMR